MNKTGIAPVEYKVLVEQDKVDENVSKSSDIAIYIPETLQEREQWKMNKGTIIAMGGMAFRDGFERWLGPIPSIGDKVSYAQYAGSNIIGSDGEEYMIVNDKDISAILTEG